MEKYKNELDKICTEKNYSYRIHNNNAIIDTPMDMWQIVEMENAHKNKKYKPFLVRHLSKNTNKIKTHPQRYAEDLEYIFNNIIEPHEGYGGVYAKMFSLSKKFKEIANN